jgi:hypothetical protein
MNEACEVCGNHYDRPLTITLDGQAHVYDSFECAIHALAPLCAHCGCRVIGHGMQDDGAIYCCAHCAQASGVSELQDRV